MPARQDAGAVRSVQALQDRWDRLRRIIAERADHYRAGGDDDYVAAIPGGTTGLLCKTWVGKEADRPVYKVDIGTLVELAEELEQWKIRTVVQAEATVTPAARALAKCLTLEQLDELERTILEEQEKPA